jgi:tetratricopeptide (TPR) repeat protein
MKPTHLTGPGVLSLFLLNVVLPCAQGAESAGSTVVSARSAPTTRAAPTTEPVEHVVTRAYEMISAGQYDDARKILEPASRTSPTNARVSLGLGYSLLKLGRVKESLPQLEKAHAATPNDRTLMLALASALQDENPMRAARILKEYMSNASHPVDEELQNDLGSVLNRGGASTKVNKESFYEECRAFYMQYDQRLNEAHGGGQRHWGTQWVDSKEAQKKWDALVTHEKEYKSASKNAELATKAKDKAKDHLEELYNGFGLHSTAEYKQGKADYDASVAHEKTAYTELHKAETAMHHSEQPPFQKSIPTPPFWQKE